MRVPVAAGSLVVLLITGASLASAQEVVGRRVFSDQIVISEPFVEDELSLPSLLHIRRPVIGGQRHAVATSVDAALKKRLTPDLEASVGGGFTFLDRDGASSIAGLDNPDIGLKYQLLRSPAREAVASIAVDWEIGGAGRAATGAEAFDTISPAVLVGKGFGDLPEAVSLLKPLAISGLFGARIPTRASTRTTSGNKITVEHHPDMLTWGVVIEYSLLYLQSYVRDLGLPAPLDRMIPIAELDFQTALDRNAAGTTVGTANVGVVWVGTTVQVGVETVIPANDRSGKHVGVRAFVRIALDEIFGGRFGRPFFGQE
jgi:hypothetical protein